MESEIDLSIAQVEAELRAAEAYLTIAGLNGDAASPYEKMRTPMESAATDFFKRPARSRPPISEDRRKEVLAKLSTERQAAVRCHVQTGGSPVEPGLRVWKEDNANEVPAAQSEGRTHVEEAEILRHEDEESGRDDGEQNALSRRQYYRQTHGEAKSDGSSDGDAENDGDDGGEVFYASDVIGRSHHEDIQPRTAFDLFSGGEDDERDGGDHSQPPYEDGAEDAGERCEEDFAKTIPTNYRPQSSHDEQTGTTPSSIVSKVLTRRGHWDEEPAISLSSFLCQEDFATRPFALSDTGQQPRADINVNDDQRGHLKDTPTLAVRQDQFQETGYAEDAYTQPSEHFPSAVQRKTQTRLDTLAAPRTSVFADREKQRLLREMEELRECTFQPSVMENSRQVGQITGPDRYGSTNKRPRAKSVRFDTQRTAAGTAFPWLTLSPRQRSKSATAPRWRNRSLIDRLNLDVTAKYEARDRLRGMMEAEKMKECTFQPQINPISKRLVSRADYKPIHERVNELQREKIQYIQRIREELAYEEGAHSFTPQINPRSREIADTVLCEKQISKVRASARRIDLTDLAKVQALLRPPGVTERLVEDAEQLVEKRMAVQDYYGALEEKAFAPRISETSCRIVEHRPEFKLDFLSRQEYFQMVEQEKMEALEDVVQHEQELTFRPDIGNAERVLREMRPDLVKESTQQRLQRLIYHEPKQAELRKQRLREETQRELTFKPEINPVSRALAARARNDINAKTARRHELQRYFAGKRFRSRVAQELEQAEKAECTFKPHLISRPKVKSSSTSKLLVKERQQDGKSIWRSDNILHTIETHRQQRAEELETKRNALELRELENCTFQPNVHRPPRRARSESAKDEQKLVVIRGLGRFLELKERAKRQQEELKQREQKVFNPNYSYEPRSYTIPKPFKLSEASKDSIRRRLKVKEEMRSKERNECTFAPQTIEAQQRKVLLALLKD